MAGALKCLPRKGVERADDGAGGHKVWAVDLLTESRFRIEFGSPFSNLSSKHMSEAAM